MLFKIGRKLSTSGAISSIYEMYNLPIVIKIFFFVIGFNFGDKKNNYNFRVKNKMPLNVHIENYKNGFYEGYDEFYNKMKIKTSKDLKGMWVMVNDYEIKDVNYAKIK